MDDGYLAEFILNEQEKKDNNPSTLIWCAFTIGCNNEATSRILAQYKSSREVFNFSVPNDPLQPP